MGYHAHMTILLHEAKLYQPPLATHILPRPHLLGRWPELLQRPLTLICAPAGFGKTTLAVAWLGQLHQHSPAPHVAWLALDEADNDPQRFWQYLLAAVQRHLPHVGQAAHALLAAGQTADPTAVVTSILNDLFAQPPSAPLLIVLDDYHLIHHLPLHEALNQWLDAAPPHVHLLLTSRADPPLALARRRARRQLLEIRAADLRFAPAECAALLNETLSLGLAAAEIATLEQYTEGWVTGLHLSALSLRHTAAPQQFITHLAGPNQYIADYLLEEVLAYQPAEVRHFLGHTAVLTELSAPLCAAVLDQPEAVSRATLDYVERQNLFLVPLDNQRGWYRYHHLLGTLLHQHLRHTADAATVRQLHQRAAVWLAEQGDLEEAIHHAFAANDPAQAAIWLEALAQQDPSLVAIRLSWLEALPAEILAKHPLLAAVYGHKLYLVPDLSLFERILHYFDTAEAGIAAQPAQRAAIVGRTAPLRMLIHILQGRPLAEVADYGEQAWAGLPATERQARGRVAYGLGLVAQKRGDLASAHHWLAQTQALITPADDAYVHYMAHAMRMLFWLDEGLVYEAHQHGRALLATLPAAPHPAAHAVQVVLGGIAVRQGRWTEGLDWLAQGAASMRLIGEYGLETTAHQMLALGEMMRGQTAVALGHVAALLERHPDAALWGRVLRYRIWLASQPTAEQMAEMVAWSGTQTAALLADPAEKTSYQTVQQSHAQVAAGRILLRQAQMGQAVDLAPVTQFVAREWAAVSPSTPHNWRLWLCLLEALVAEAEGRTAVADTSLGRALAMGQQVGEVLAFVEWGAGIRPLLYRAITQGEGATRAYAQQLYAALPAAEEPTGKAASAPLLEPLTERELDVLRLLAEGLSNKEIGLRLHLSANTVRIHASNIYGKLGVNGRVAAVTTAQGLGIFDF